MPSGNVRRRRYRITRLRSAGAADWFAGSTATSNVDAKNLAYFITDGKPAFYDLGTATKLSDVKVIDRTYSSDKYLDDTTLNLKNYVLGDTVTYRDSNRNFEVVNSKGKCSSGLKGCLVGRRPRWELSSRAVMART